jgi:hypothetical protein
MIFCVLFVFLVLGMLYSGILCVLLVFLGLKVLRVGVLYVLFVLFLVLRVVWLESALWSLLAPVHRTNKQKIF